MKRQPLSDRRLDEIGAEFFAEEDRSREGEEPSFCGRRGKRCRWAPAFCDYHVNAGDAEYHRRVDDLISNREE